MTVDAETLENIRANAAMAIERLGDGRGEQVGYDSESARWVDGFIERQRVREGLNADGLISVVGCYLGDALISATGGRWDQWDDHARGVLFPNNARAFPFSKVRKQFDHGTGGGESIAGFFDTAVKMVATDALGGDGAD